MTQRAALSRTHQKSHWCTLRSGPAQLLQHPAHSRHPSHIPTRPLLFPTVSALGSTWGAHRRCTPPTPCPGSAAGPRSCSGRRCPACRHRTCRSACRLPSSTPPPEGRPTVLPLASASHGPQPACSGQPRFLTRSCHRQARTHTLQHNKSRVSLHDGAHFVDSSNSWPSSRSDPARSGSLPWRTSHRQTTPPWAAHSTHLMALHQNQAESGTNQRTRPRGGVGGGGGGGGR